MKNEFVTAITQLCAEKGVPREVVMEALEAALVSAYKRNFESAGQNVVAEIDPGTGAVHVYLEQEVAEPAEGEELEPHQVTLVEARKVKANAQLGEVLRHDVTPQNFGRIAAQTAKQVVLQKLRDAERKLIYDEFADRKDEIVHGIVQRVEQGNAIVELGKAEALMPKSEQVPTERYYPGQRIRVYVAEVHDTHRGPQIIVSRSHRFMLRRLFEQEVPEIFNGTVEIKAIAREAGARSKVAVVARQAGIDPVGSCVGMRGVRIQNIVNELGGEKIDVVQWDEEPRKFVANALSPAQVLGVELSEVEKTARVVVPERQLSLAIGKEGQNARLAAKLTGWRIDIKSDVAAAEEARKAAERAGATAASGAGDTNGPLPEEAGQLAPSQAVDGSNHERPDADEEAPVRAER
ncbi:MAG: transcription termination/antitermination protein NusA [Chloroflexi bacterium]|nr:transcription termination/antitermination protein NusA [Chloroflexota bacterium]